MGATSSSAKLMWPNTSIATGQSRRDAAMDGAAGRRLDICAAVPGVRLDGAAPLGVVAGIPRPHAGEDVNVWIFQCVGGHLSGLLRFTPTGSIDPDDAHLDAG